MTVVMGELADPYFESNGNVGRLFRPGHKKGGSIINSTQPFDPYTLSTALYVPGMSEFEIRILIEFPIRSSECRYICVRLSVQENVLHTFGNRVSVLMSIPLFSGVLVVIRVY